MKINKNKMLSFTLALLLILPLASALLPAANAEEMEEPKSLPAQLKYERTQKGYVWYRFETPLITLLFPANGTKPMFIWWYTNDSSKVYVVKFKGVIEYLRFILPYYNKRYQADNVTIKQVVEEKFIEPKLSSFKNSLREQYEQYRKTIIKKLIFWLADLHPPYLPFSGCKWELSGPKLVSKDDISYWAFNFALKRVPFYRFRFAENNIQIRCRFYNTTTTEVIDENHNYTVAAGQLKFDFVVSNWEWNVDKLNDFLDWLREWNPELNITIPTDKAGLALWINMASINIEDLPSVKDEALSQPTDLVEGMSKMKGVIIGDQYYNVERDETSQDEKPIEATLRLRERFRERIRLHFHRGKTDVPVGFLEFVPWARLLNETGDTVDFVNVTASYIAAGHHLRLFICYPYFGNYTLEHDPTIGLASAPPLPTLLTPEIIAILMLATVIITIVILAYRRKKETINIISP
ncbi:hypothetical protein J7K27_06730 [Candidatus Bathyarchaeota archaeon]|nr:hypothetical protein [Candidatus Bathyarchaeota archaeon]